MAGTDPGFPVGGGANPPERMPTYKFARFSQKLHEIKKMGGGGGGARWEHPPLRSTTAWPTGLHSLGKVV